MSYFKKVYRIRTVERFDNKLRVQFDDDRIMTVPLAQISPRKGKADWSTIAIQCKGIFFSVPVTGGDDAEHEVPWDVLRKVGLIEARKQARRRRSSKMSAS